MLGRVRLVRLVSAHAKVGLMVAIDRTRLTRCPNEKNIKSILHPDENRANFTDIMKGYCRSKLLLFFPY